jgi:hypothetical protein
MISDPPLPTFSPREITDGMTNSGEISALTATPSSEHSDFSVPPPASYTRSMHDMYDSSLTGQPEMALDTAFLPRHQEPMVSYAALNQFPAFFEQVMLPSLDTENGLQGTQQPRAFDFMQDIDFTLSDNDVFGTKFIPDLDKILDMAAPFSEFDNQQSSPDDEESASRRAAAFQKSLWCVPLAKLVFTGSWS